MDSRNTARDKNDQRKKPKRKNKHANSLQKELKNAKHSLDKEIHMVEYLKLSIQNLEQQLNLPESELERLNLDNIEVIFQAFEASGSSLSNSTEKLSKLREAILNNHTELLNANYDILNEITAEDQNLNEQKASIEQELIESIYLKIGTDLENIKKEYNKHEDCEKISNFIALIEIALLKSLKQHIYNLEQTHLNGLKVARDQYEIKEKELDESLWKSHADTDEKLSTIGISCNKVIGKNLNDVRILQLKHSELKDYEQKLLKSLEDSNKFVKKASLDQFPEPAEGIEAKLSELDHTLAITKKQIQRSLNEIQNRKLQYFVMDQKSDELKEKDKKDFDELRRSLYTDIQRNDLRYKLFSTDKDVMRKFEQSVASMSHKISLPSPKKKVCEEGLQHKVDFRKDKVFQKAKEDIYGSMLKAERSYKNLILASRGWVY